MAKRMNPKEVPPELRPYFSNHPTWVRLCHRVGHFLPLIVAALIILAALGGTLWFRAEHRQPASHKTTSSSSEKQPATATPPSDSSSTAATQPSDNTPSASSDTAVSDTTPSPTPSDLLNTGPGEAVVVIALAVTILGTMGNYARQLRSLRR